jgi:hypothetical protein
MVMESPVDAKKAKDVQRGSSQQKLIEHDVFNEASDLDDASVSQTVVSSVITYHQHRNRSKTRCIDHFQRQEPLERKIQRPSLPVLGTKHCHQHLQYVANGHGEFGFGLMVDKRIRNK